MLQVGAETASGRHASPKSCFQNVLCNSSISRCVFDQGLCLGCSLGLKATPVAISPTMSIHAQIRLFASLLSPKAAILGVRRVLGHRCRQPVQRAQLGSKFDTLQRFVNQECAIVCCTLTLPRDSEVSFRRDCICCCPLWNCACCCIPGKGC